MNSKTLSKKSIFFIAIIFLIAFSLIPGFFAKYTPSVSADPAVNNTVVAGENAGEGFLRLFGIPKEMNQGMLYKIPIYENMDCIVYKPNESASTSTGENLSPTKPTASYREYLFDMLGTYTIVYTNREFKDRADEGDPLELNDPMMTTHTFTVLVVSSTVTLRFDNNPKNIIPTNISNEFASYTGTEGKIFIPIPTILDEEGEIVTFNDEIRLSYTVHKGGELLHERQINFLNKNVVNPENHYFNVASDFSGTYVINYIVKKVGIDTANETYSGTAYIIHTQSISIGASSETPNYQLETSFSSVPETTASVGIAKTLPGVEGKNKDTKIIVPVFYKIKVYHRATESGTFNTNIDIADKVISKNEDTGEMNVFTADREGWFKFEYIINDIYYNETKSSTSKHKTTLDFEMKDLKDNIAPTIIITEAYDSVDYNTKVANGDELVSRPYLIPSVWSQNDVYIPAIYATDNFSKTNSKFTFKREFRLSNNTVYFTVEGHENQWIVLNPTLTKTVGGETTTITPAQYEQEHPGVHVPLNSANEPYSFSYSTYQIIYIAIDEKENETISSTYNFRLSNLFGMQSSEISITYPQLFQTTPLYVGDTLTFAAPTLQDKYQETTVWDTNPELGIFYAFLPENVAYDSTFDSRVFAPTGKYYAAELKNGLYSIDISKNLSNGMYLHIVTYAINDGARGLTRDSNAKVKIPGLDDEYYSKYYTYYFRDKARKGTDLSSISINNLVLIPIRYLVDMVRPDLTGFTVNVASDADNTPMNDLGGSWIDGDYVTLHQNSRVTLPTFTLTDSDGYSSSIRNVNPSAKVEYKTNDTWKEVTGVTAGTTTRVGGVMTVSGMSFIASKIAEYRVTFRAVDAGGNIVIKIFTFTGMKSVIPPTINFSSLPPELTGSSLELDHNNYSKRTIKLPVPVLIDSNNEELNTSAYEYEVRVLEDSPSAFSFQNDQTVFEPLCAGTFRLQYVAHITGEDPIYSKVYTVTAADTTKPTIVLNKEIILPSVLPVSSTPVRIPDFSVKDFIGTGVDYSRCEVRITSSKNSLPRTIPFGDSNYTFAFDENAVFTITYTAYDLAENPNYDTATLTIKVGKTVPPLLKGKLGKEIESSFTLKSDGSPIIIDLGSGGYNFTATPTDETGEDTTDTLMSTIKYKLRNTLTGADIENTNEDYQLPGRFVITTEGSYTLTITVTDSAGNESSPFTRTFMVEKAKDGSDSNIDIANAIGITLIVLSVLVVCGVAAYFIISQRKIKKIKNAK